MSCGGCTVSNWSEPCWPCLRDGGWEERRKDEERSWRTALRRMETFEIPE